MEDIKRAAAGNGAEPLYTQTFWRAAVQKLLAAGPVCISGPVDLAGIDMAPKHWHIERETKDHLEARPIEHWHDDTGHVLWWKFPIDEPPWCGRPDDSDWPGYHTHWTRIDVPMEVPA